MSHLTRAYRVANQMSSTSQAILYLRVKPYTIGPYRFSRDLPPDRYTWERLSVYPDGSILFTRNTTPELRVTVSTEEELVATLAELGLPAVDLEHEAWCTDDGDFRPMEDTPVTFL